MNSAHFRLNNFQIRESLGDTREAFEHNQQAMKFEQQQQLYPITTSCYRSTAIQNITLGGDVSYSLELMNAARRLEHKNFNSYEFVSKQRTNEIIHKISLRKEHPMETYHRMMKEQEEKKSLEEAIRKGDVSAILNCRQLKN